MTEVRFQRLSDDLLVSSYLKAIELKLDDSFIKLLFNEIEQRNIQHQLIRKRNANTNY